MHAADNNIHNGNELDDADVELVPSSFNSDSDNEIPSTSNERKKRTRIEVPTCFAAKNRKRREKGKSYLGKQKVGNTWNYEKAKEPRTLKDRCGCKKNISMKCTQITDVDRKQIFTKFWKMTWDEKKMYVNTLIQTVPTLRFRNRKVNNVSKRCRTFQYYLKVENSNIRVCKTFFLNTLNIGRRTVIDWTDTNSNGGRQCTLRCYRICEEKVKY